MSGMKKIFALLSAFFLLLSLTSCGDGAKGGQGGSGADVGGQSTSSQISQSAELETVGPDLADGAAGADSSSENGAADQSPEDADPTEPSQPSGPLSKPIEPITEEESTVLKMEIAVGDKTFPATLYDNAAARALLELLPMTLEMSELNGNEKYYYLDNSLPTDPGRPSGIHTGDIMLYGDSCLVMFYKSFSTSYSYTLLGRMDDLDGLVEAVGSGDVQVSFRKAG